MKRFSENRLSKLTNFVEFPTGERALNMAPYAANSTSVQYSLYGICDHMGKHSNFLQKKYRFFLQLITLMLFIGSVDLGHYVAKCKDSTGKWHKFNDER